MTRIVSQVEARAWLENYGRYSGKEFGMARPMRTIIQQDEQIERLQHAVRFLESAWGSDIITELREKGILADKDMEP